MLGFDVVMAHLCGTMDPSSEATWEMVLVANKDKGGRSSKKAASRSLKEKRQAKKAKRAGDTRKPL